MANQPASLPMSLQWKMDTDFRVLYLVASAKGLQGIYWSKQKEVPVINSLNGVENSDIKSHLRETVKQLEEYFQGQRKVFDLKTHVTKGTEFQRRVWKELLKIPYGERRSYKQLASKLNTKAYRAVGSANGKNPLSIIVPCHRVIAADGGIGGYAGGISFKKKLLNLENNESSFFG